MELYLDMDGVLVDFDKGAKITFGDLYKNHEIPDHAWKFIHDKPEFWSDLDWMPGGRQLWEATASLNPFLLSAYNKLVMRCTVIGKMDWIERELGIPLWRAKLVDRKDKVRYARDFQGESNILIDDFETNIVDWRQHGGIGIHYQNTNQALAELAAFIA